MRNTALIVMLDRSLTTSEKTARKYRISTVVHFHNKGEYVNADSGKT
jgi:hypothetical protein